MFAAFLDPEDARRVADVMAKLSTHGFHEAAMTGGLAIEAQLTANGHLSRRRALNDLDFVVGSFVSIPRAVANEFLVHHVHPDAPPGKILLQLIDRDRALRIDLFRAFGATLARTDVLAGPAGSLKVVSIEDLVVRTTAHVYVRLRQHRPVDVKHAQAFRRLVGFGAREKIDAAWVDHRQDLEETFQDASRQAERLLTLYPELLIHERYSSIVTPCEQCRDYGAFRRAEPDTILSVLGYW
jgi:hypothetical protein